MKIHRSLVATLAASAMALAISTDVRAQLMIPKDLVGPKDLPTVEILTPHHVTGAVQRGVCSSGLVGSAISVHEYWYEGGNAGPPIYDLVLPGDHDATPYLDPLSFMGKPLVQGRRLGSATVAADGTFDVTWSESANRGRTPWAINVLNGRTGERLTAYRVLALKIDLGQSIVADLNPIPLITFFGTETTKEVGRLKVNCLLFG
jgi:hypothetical protein